MIACLDLTEQSLNCQHCLGIGLWLHLIRIVFTSQRIHYQKSRETREGDDLN